MILYYFDAMLHELVCWPDSGEHEDLGGVDGTRGQDDLFAGLDAHHAAVHAEVLYARCLQGLGVHQHPSHVSVGPHCPRKSDYTVCQWSPTYLIIMIIMCVNRHKSILLGDDRLNG